MSQFIKDAQLALDLAQKDWHQATVQERATLKKVQEASKRLQHLQFVQTEIEIEEQRQNGNILKTLSYVQALR